MIRSSKIIYAMPDGLVLPGNQTITWTGVGSTATGALSNVYANLPSVVLSGTPTTIIARPIPCAGFQAAFLTPMLVENVATPLTMTWFVYGIWSSSQVGGDDNFYVARLLTSIAMTGSDSDSNSSATSLVINPRVAGQTSYRAASAISNTQSLAAVTGAQFYGGTAGAQTVAHTRVNATAELNCVLVSNLLGCDYLAFSSNSTADDKTPNLMVSLHNMF